MKKIIINIGNTNTEIAESANIEETISIISTKVFFQKQTQLLMNLAESAKIIVASVIPNTEKILQKLYPKLVFTFLTHKLITDIDFSQVDISTVGADRLANCVAMKTLLSLPAAIIDCGTAITAEIVDKENVFQGGFIMPGRILQRQALKKSTGQLPEVKLKPTLPKNACGKSTEEAILAGIDLGIIGSVTSLIQSIHKKFPHIAFYATGGDADFFVENIPTLKQCPNFFTLKGLQSLSL